MWEIREDYDNRRSRRDDDDRRDYRYEDGYEDAMKEIEKSDKRYR